MTTSLSFGIGYYNSKGYTFPQPFVDTPTVTPLQNQGTGGITFGSKAYAITTTTLTIQLGGFSSTSTGYPGYRAIGKWSNFGTYVAPTAPQSGVVDSGSNTDGSYIKYGDGTMICWITQSMTGVTSANGTANFPQPFTSSVQSLGLNRYRTTTSSSLINQNTPSAAVRAISLTQYIWMLSGASASYGYTLEASFVGKWK
jgi:hypothetical protein